MISIIDFVFNEMTEQQERSCIATRGDDSFFMRTPLFFSTRICQTKSHFSSITSAWCLLLKHQAKNTRRGNSALVSRDEKLVCHIKSLIIALPFSPIHSSFLPCPNWGLQARHLRDPSHGRKFQQVLDSNSCVYIVLSKYRSISGKRTDVFSQLSVYGGYPTIPASSHNSRIDYCCSFWLPVFLVGLKCTLTCTFPWHLRCFASSCERGFRKNQSTPPSQRKYKYSVIPLAHMPETNSDLHFPFLRT